MTAPPPGLVGSTPAQARPDPGRRAGAGRLHGPRPPGDAPLRYRDLVFGGVTKTADVQYGTAPNLQGNPVDLKFDFYQPPATP